MTFQEWFNSAPHRAKYTKYSNDHPAYLAAQEAWEAAHEACARVCDEMYRRDGFAAVECEAADECAAIARAEGTCKAEVEQA